MKQIKSTDDISVLMKKISPSDSRHEAFIVETKKMGDSMYGILAEGGKYIIKRAVFVEGKNYAEQDFKYINGVQNRTKYLSETVVSAKKQLNYLLNENIHSEERSPIKESDKKFVIKKDAPELSPDMPADDDTLPTDGDAGSDSTEGGEETAEDIEAGLDEYQELAGKLSYILRTQDEEGYSDTAKYIFNSLIAALNPDKLGDDVANSIKEKMTSKFESGDEGGNDNKEDMPEAKSFVSNEDEDDILTEGKLKAKGYKIVETYSKAGFLALMNGKNAIGAFNQPTKRHGKGAMGAIGDSQPYGEAKNPNEMERGGLDMPFVEGIVWEDYEEDHIDSLVSQMEVNQHKAKAQDDREDWLFSPKPVEENDPSLEELLSDEFINI